MWVYLNLTLGNVRRKCKYCKNKAEVVSHDGCYLCLSCYDSLILKRKPKNTTTTQGATK